MNIGTTVTDSATGQTGTIVRVDPDFWTIPEGHVAVATAGHSAPLVCHPDNLTEVTA